MNITLRREDQQFIEEQVKAGRFASAEDVVGAALERLRHDDFSGFAPGELDELIAEGEADIRRGDVITLDELREDLRRRPRHRRHHRPVPEDRGDARHRPPTAGHQESQLPCQLGLLVPDHLPREGRTVFISRVVHGSRDLRRLFR